ncbi:MAG: ABC transporter permease [Acidimicrobiales bacterium]
MRLYWEVARRGYRRFATYRGATAAGVFTNTVFGFLRGYVLLGVFRHRGEVGGLDAGEALTFVFVTQGFIALVGAFSALDISARIRTGDVVTDLYRPVDFQAYWLAHDLGRAAFHGVFRGIPPVVIGAAAFDLRLPTSPAVWVAFAASTTLAVVASFGLRFLVSLSGFWLLDTRGVQNLSVIVLTFFSGLVLPIGFFPGWLETLARALPYSALAQVPVEVLLGRHHGPGLAGALAFQAAWALALLFAGRRLLGAATRKLVVHGG